MIVAIVEDMIFASRILAQGKLHGANVELRSAAACSERMPDGVRCALIDLDLSDALMIIRRLRAVEPTLRVIAFGPHVQAERLRAARDAGATEALPRSKFVERLPELLQPVGDETASRDSPA